MHFMQNGVSALFLRLWSSLSLPVLRAGLSCLLGSVINCSLTRGWQFSSFLIAQLTCSGSRVWGSIAICDFGGVILKHTEVWV